MNTKRLTPLLEKELGPLSIAMFLRVARNSMNLTQTEMAKKLGMLEELSVILKKEDNW